MAARSAEADLVALKAMALAVLRTQWALVTQRPAPRVSRAMLCLALAYELQS